MDQVLVFATLLVLVAVAGALAVLPLRLPWPQRVRWTVLSQATAYVGPGPIMYPPLDIREIRLVSVDIRADKISMEVLETGHPSCHTLFLVGAAPLTGDRVAMLREWCALQTPMLLYMDPAGIASLHGPVASITGLRTLGRRAQQAA